MSEQRNCLVCLHAKVCRYIERYQTLVQLGHVEFDCRYCLTKKPNNKPAAERVAEGSFEKSIEELSREVNGDNAEDAKPKTVEGTCHICHNDGDVYICSECGKPTCGNCGEFTEAIDLLGEGDTKTIFVCKECDE